MADKEAAPKREEAIVVCLYPDVCKSPDKPAPYQIVAYYSDMEDVSTNVRITGAPATTSNSRIPRVYNNEPGVGGGSTSGVNRGYCRPSANWSSTINVNRTPLLRHDVELEMNCNGPEGSSNTTGKTVYMTGAPLACIAPDGAIAGGTNPPVKTTDEEEGWLSRTWSRTKEVAGQAWGKANELNREYKILTRAAGGLQAVGGVGQMIVGAAGLAAPTGVTQVLGGVAVVHGADDTGTGLTQLWTGEPQRTLTEQAATATATTLGASPETAEQIGSGFDMAAGMINPAGAGKAVVKEGIQEGSERLGKELAEKEARELAEKEAKEAAEKEARETAEKEAREAAEKEAKQASDGQDGAQVHRAPSAGDIQFGNNPNQVSHAFRHTDAAGLDRSAVKSGVENHLRTVESQIVSGKPFNQVIEVAGQRIQYTAFRLPNGVINVGRIHPVP